MVRGSMQKYKNNNIKGLRLRQAALSGAIAIYMTGLLVSPTVHAASCPGTLSLSIGACTLSGIDTLDVTNTGVIDALGNVTPAVSVDGFASGVTINTSGLIKGDVGSAGISVNGSASGTTITNNKDGQIIGLDSAGIHFLGSLDGLLTNSGSVSGISSVPGLGFSLNLNSGNGIVNNLAGGLLSGNLHTGGTIAVNNSGTIDIPVGAAATILGNFTQSASGNLGFGVESTASYGSLTVGNTATFTSNSDINVNVAMGDTLANGDSLQDVVSASSLAASTFTVTDNRPLLSFTAVIDGSNNVDLIVRKTTFYHAIGGSGVRERPDAAALDGFETPSTLNVASVFDKLSATGGGTVEMAAVLTSLNGIETIPELVDALNQTLPMVITNIPSSILNNQHGVQRLVTARMDSNLNKEQGINSGDSFYGDRHFWLKPYGSWTDQDEVNGYSGYDSDSVGIVIGVDGAIGSSRYNQGVAFSYINTNIDQKAPIPQMADVNSFQGIVYGKYGLNDVSYLKWQADFAFHNTETERGILLMGTVAHADYNSWSIHMGTSLDRKFVLSKHTSFIPSIGINYTHVHTDDYTETGAGPLNLMVKSNDIGEVYIGADGKLEHNLTDSLQIIANLGCGYDLIDDEASTIATFAGYPSTPFTNKAIDPFGWGVFRHGWLADGGVGLVYGSEDSLQITGQYNIVLQEEFTNQSASIKMKIPF